MASVAECGEDGTALWGRAWMATQLGGTLFLEQDLIDRYMDRTQLLYNFGNITWITLMEQIVK